MVSEGTPAHTMQTQRAVEEAQAVEATWYVRIATGKLTALPSGYAEIRSSCIPRGSVFFSTLYVYFQGFSRAMIRLARRVWRFPNLTARVGSGQDMFQISRVGSGWVRPFPNVTGRAGSPCRHPTREKWLHS